MFCDAGTSCASCFSMRRRSRVTLSVVGLSLLIGGLAGAAEANSGAAISPNAFAVETKASISKSDSRVRVAVGIPTNEDSLVQRMAVMVANQVQQFGYERGTMKLSPILDSSVLGAQFRVRF